LIIRFNKNGVVKKIEYKDTTEQKPAEFVQRKTPTKGKELNALQQMLGNIGKFKPPKTD
jgi:outer membrane protein assembly factor BamE (lipoprotein component of BamABCDE complex)